MDKDLKRFRKGSQYVRLLGPVTKKELTKADQVSDNYLNMKCIKFIPASGAATRMFQDLYQYLDNNKETPYIKEFFEGLESFPFYEDLRDFIDKYDLDKNHQEDRQKIIEYFLNDPMHYGSLPKALIKVNRYEDFSTNPIQEHLYEGKTYLNPLDMNFHFTLSKDHESLFNEFIENHVDEKESTSITYSFQKKKTDTMAVDLNKEPFKLEDGSIFYRPGGHGALIENLNDLQADLIFIKNIDNVCHRTMIEDTTSSKKKLASIGYHYKNIIDGHIRGLLSEDYDLKVIERFMKEVLNISLYKPLTKALALSFLNRPLRVCGMVKNQGEPGGGPFMVDHRDYSDLQICEKSEINLEDPKQKEILDNSQYFNPVDLVCFVKDYQGKKFDLLDYVNEDRYFISQKSYKGKDILALEHPGLWNGAMDKWNTFFVEVPLSTFNPVKKVNDLLKRP